MHSHSQIYIPNDLNSKQNKVVFQTIHHNQDAALYWHLNNSYLKKTQVFHQQAIWIEAGNHKTTLVDENANTIQREFKVIGPQ